VNAVQKGDIILVELTGRDAESRKVFETTSEETAKKEGIASSNAIFKPTPVIVGKERLIKGLEEALLEMNVGEERKITLEPEKAFGERKPLVHGPDPSEVILVSDYNYFYCRILFAECRSGVVAAIF